MDPFVPSETWKRAKAEVDERERINTKELEKLSKSKEDIEEIIRLFPSVDFNNLPYGNSPRDVGMFIKSYLSRKDESKRKHDATRGKADELLINAGMPYRLRNAKNSDIPESVHKAIGDGSAYLCGPAGTGKSYIAAAWMRSCLESYKAETYIVKDDAYGDAFKVEEFNKHKYLPIFISVPDLLLDIRDTFKNSNNGDDSEKSIIDSLTTERPLILDDIGAEKTSDWSLQTLYTIIDRRYRNEYRTIITSNLTPQELGYKLGDRIASRIAGMCKVIELKGKDRRLT